jgi:hypothetical protein
MLRKFVGAGRWIGASASLLALARCSSGTEPSSFTENVDVSVCDPTNGGFSADISNAYFPLPVGATLALDGVEDGAAVHLVITSLDQTEVVAGITTRVMEERESHDGALVEVSRNFLAQTSNGTVCYFGEDVDIYEAGAIVSHEGQWRAGVANALPGILMPGSPTAGMAFREERAPGVAEDRAEIAAAGESVEVPAGTFSTTLRFVETTPLESGTSTKVYARDVGLIVDDAARLTSHSP